MKFAALTIALFACSGVAHAQVTADTPVSDEQFAKACAVMTSVDPGPYCACVALEIAKVATTDRELLFARQSIAMMDPAFGYPSYQDDDLATFVDMTQKALTGTATCGRAATMNTLNPDGTIQ